MNDQLKQCRELIDRIDEQILRLANERAKLAHQIGGLKEDGIIYRPEREAQVLRRLVELNQGPLPAEAVTAIFRNVMSNCRAMEKELTVAFLGPKGTYSEDASIKQFGDAAIGEPCVSIDEVFRCVETRVSDYGIVPVENSTEGAVGRTLDLLAVSPLRICGEVSLPIHHNLLSTHTQLNEIQVVYAHAQALAQCQQWLNQHLPQARRESVMSNAEAAKLALMHPEQGAAAIASDRAAEIFSLNTLSSSIEDDPKNTTRFLVLGHQEVNPSGQDKTSLVVSTKNIPGAMVQLLEPLARFGVSMTKLETRPSKGGLWEYLFFIDIVGHVQDEAVNAALNELSQRASLMRVLGSYPVAVS